MPKLIAGPTPPSGSSARFVRGDVPGYFAARHAISAEDAVGYVPQKWLDRRVFDHLRKTGVIREVRAGAFYLDLAAYFAASEERSRRGVQIALGLSFFVIFVAMFFYRG
ncbi:hypothetical protein BH09PSE4_BH09PSE4_23340 [soil metagenome]